MASPPELDGFYAGWAAQQANLLESIRPLTMEQVQLRPAPGEWAIWQLASNLAGGRLYWLCHMLGEDDLGHAQLFRVEHTTVPGLPLEWAGWEDDEDRPRGAGELVDALEKTWQVVQRCIERWNLPDLTVEVTAQAASGDTVSVTRGEVLWRIMSHDVHHGSEISLILRVHGLPTRINR